MRKFVNHTAMDIFYYTSPRYRNEIISALQNEMNKIYKMFIDRNPAFTGKVYLVFLFLVFFRKNWST